MLIKMLPGRKEFLVHLQAPSAVCDWAIESEQNLFIFLAIDGDAQVGNDEMLFQALLARKLLAAPILIA